MPRLYDLVPAYQGAMEELEKNPEQLEMWLDTVDSLNMALDVKVDGYCKMMAMLNDTDGIKAESKRLADRARAQENAAKALKDRLQGAMELLGRDKFKTDLFTVSLQANPGKVEIHDIDLIPAEYKRTTVLVEPDKKAIGDALKAGRGIAGAELVQGRSLRIR